MNLCPCCSGKPYETCCQPFLDGLETPSHPQHLMRSRYSAFCLKRSDYLIQTLLPAKRRHPVDRAEIESSLILTFSDTVWLGLSVLSETLLSPAHATVEFAAFYKRNGGRGQLHELSNFVKEEGTWYYNDGAYLPDITLGRNALCFCGSGKKYKRCHGGNI